MPSFFCWTLLTASALAAVLPRQTSDARDTGQNVAIPSTPKAPGTFSTGATSAIGEPPQDDSPVPDIYGPREVDIPFGRMYQGNLNFYKTVNDPTSNTGSFGSHYDNANQSACGIPANAFAHSQVAIHPYFLKYAGLDRFCQQDVCIDFWREDFSADMMLKVTDICTSDSADGVPCMTPQDIKVDRSKAYVIFNQELGNKEPTGDQYPEKVWWFFTKCYADGLVQPAYQNTSNWFADPYLPNNFNWALSTHNEQYNNNQATYAAKGWPLYNNCIQNHGVGDVPVNDWVPGQEPAWTPIAGGASQSLPGGGGAAAAPAAPATSNASSIASSDASPVASLSAASEASSSTLSVASNASTTPVVVPSVPAFVASSASAAVLSFAISSSTLTSFSSSIFTLATAAVAPPLPSSSSSPLANATSSSPAAGVLESAPAATAVGTAVGTAASILSAGSGPQISAVANSTGGPRRRKGSSKGSWPFFDGANKIWESFFRQKRT